jgi:hypothetical protein
MSDAAFYLCVVILAIFFVGDPDLHDVLVAYIKSASACKP